MTQNSSNCQRVFACPRMVRDCGSVFALRPNLMEPRQHVRRAVAIAVRITAVLVAACTLVHAQSLPTPWVGADIGAPTLSGSAAHSSGVFTIDAAGTDIWGTSDQFHFVYQQISGDVDVIARVQNITNQHAWSKAGVMIRATLAANAPNAYVLASAAKGVSFQRRASSGAVSTATAASTTAVPPAWVRAVRSGTRVTTYWSTNGTSWTTIGSVTLPLGTSAYVGIAVTSHNPGARTTATVSNVTVVRGGLPAGQRSADIGSPAIAGSTTHSSGVYTVKAAGIDIWDTADQFHFVYQPMTGNGEVVARVASITNAHAWSKGGVMIREALTGQSRHASVFASVGKGYAFQRRPETAGLSVHTAGGSGTAPVWVRLVRNGDLFQAYRSANGTSWTSIGSDTIPMTSTVYVGLAVTSHNASATTTAVIDSLRITGGAPSNQAPAVSVTSPSSGAQFTMPATVTITATATDPEGRMASVDFFAGSTLIRRDTSSPYSATWSPSSAGTYSLTAVAHDADGGSTTSGAVSVTVQGANRAPMVTLTSPASGASFTAPASIAMTASASDPEGQLTRVDFLNGTTVVGTDTTGPYAFTWSNVAAGSYTLRAVAYDAAGASATSAAVTVTVTTASGPPRTVVFTASSNHATAVTNYLLEVFASGANPATATPVATSDLGKPAPAGNNDITVDRATFFNGLAAGNYVATVSAIGVGGRTRSTSVTFTR
jgi:regulation of enolase protein 1 (concanavalin A-like superfamily)